jgi:nucleoside-diphosphate-sugar epimerase
MEFRIDELQVATCSFAGKVLAVTGYDGFVGRNFLADKCYEVVPLHMASPQIVLHCAALAEESLAAFCNNTGLDVFVFQYCREHRAKLIYTSTNNVYPLKEDCVEEGPLQNNGLYSLSKIAGENLLLNGAFKDLDAVVLRMADVFGKGQYHGNLFKAIVSSMHEKRPIKLYGTGSKKRSYIYIKDLVKVLEYFINFNGQEHYKIYNVGYTDPASVFDIVARISALTGLPVEAVEYSEKWDTRTMQNSRLLMSGFPFSYHLDTALADFVEEVQRD